jgi:hypothetical protein
MTLDRGSLDGCLIGILTGHVANALDDRMRGIIKKVLNVECEITMAPEGYFIVHLWKWEGHMTGNWRERYHIFARALIAKRIRDLPTLVNFAPEYWQQLNEESDRRLREQLAKWRKKNQESPAPAFEVADNLLQRLRGARDDQARN